MIAEDLGAFDVAVQGGGIPGVVQAIRYRDRGNKVVIVEDRGSLLREITRARQTYIQPAPDLPPSSFYRDLQDELVRCQGYKETQFEPCRTELAAERIVRQRGIAILYQARLLTDRSAQASGKRTVVLKGKLGTLTAGLFVGGSDAPGTGARHSVWTSTWLNAPVDRVTETVIAVDNRRLPVRLRPGFYEDTAYVDIVYPHDSERTVAEELAFNSKLGELVGSLRSQSLILKYARLSHLCDEPYYVQARPDENSNLDGIWARLDKDLAASFALR